MYLLFPLARVPDVGSPCVCGVLCVHEMVWKTSEVPILPLSLPFACSENTVPETLTGGGRARPGPQDGCPLQSVFCQDDGIPEAGISTAKSFIQPKFLKIQGYDSGTSSFWYEPCGITTVLPRGSD